MKAYLVGGCVRDGLMGIPVHDRDWVVVGSSVEEMLSLGYSQVGKDFPVFLHPETKEEYALARTEKKAGNGYYGFEVNTDRSVTLEEDLRRRDLTINAMAKDPETGEIIDPFNGVVDLENRILRHVSDAFAEDPVRVLRVARFAARYGFKVADETIDLMKHLVDSGELNYLVPERIWQELSRAIHEKIPSEFFFTLLRCGAAEVIFPEAARVIFETGRSVHKCALYNFTLEQSIATWLHYIDRDKSTNMLERLKAPSSVIEFCMLFKDLSDLLNKLLDADQIVSFLSKNRLWSKPDTLISLVQMTLIIGFNDRWADRMESVMQAFHAAKHISFDSLTKNQQTTLQGPDIHNAINTLRTELISKVLLKSRS